MKNKKNIKLEDIPPLVAYVWAASSINVPIGAHLFEKALNEHPEWFPKEIEYRKRWMSVPKSVHKQHDSELTEERKRFFSGVPESKGLSGWINDPEGLIDWQKKRNEASRLFEPIKKRIHEKYYSKYGIDYET